MKLSDVIKVWDILHVRDTGELGFCDLERAIDAVVGTQNDCKNLQEIQLRIGSKKTIKTKFEIIGQICSLCGWRGKPKAKHTCEALKELKRRSK